jgi:acetyltransferase-like isoleucine patch superfamily enzyme
MILIGAGQNSLDVLSFIPHQEVFFIDDFKVGKFEGYKILGTVDDLCQGRIPIRYPVYNAVGSVGDNTTRNRIYEKLKKAGLRVQPLIFPSHICHNVQIGENVVIGLGSQIHHDCMIGESCILSPRVTLCGAVTLSDNVFLGVGAIIIQGITVGKNAIVGAGSLVIRDVPDNVTVVGNPARIIEKTEG